VQDAFMAGLHTSSLVIGVLCLVGAVVAVLSLPGRVPPVVLEEDLPGVPDEARAPSVA
jgi:hypothetical protein